MKVTFEIECEDRDSLRAVLAHLADVIELDEFPTSEPMDDYQCFGEDIGEARVDFWPHSLTDDGLDVAVRAVVEPPRITAIDREIKCGSCTLTGLLNDGSTRKLFSYYVDELSFADSELIGLTEDEAHKLFRSRDVAYLRS